MASRNKKDNSQDTKVVHVPPAPRREHKPEPAPVREPEPEPPPERRSEPPAPLDISTDDRLLVEVGWEVCNQVGGIYTVLRTKSQVTTRRYGDRYCLVGPYNESAADTEFEPLPLAGTFGRAVELLRERGVVAHFGRWLVSGKPQVILIDFAKHFDKLNQYKYFLWKDHGIETTDDREVADVVLFGYLVAELFEVLDGLVAAVATRTRTIVPELEGIVPPVIGQFHEWMGAAAIPEIRRRGLQVASIFTTHATLLGRYLASDDHNFYNFLPQIDPGGSAYARGIHPRYAIERSAAASATAFTTVSEITGYEAQHFLGRAPDVLLPNGLNIHRFTALHEFQNRHAVSKQKIHDFVVGHFFPSYAFDLDRTLYVVTSGRYEYTNKGLDLFIEALARLNWRLKSTRQRSTIVAFIITRAPNRGMNVDVLKSQVLFGELETTVRAIAEQMRQRLLESVAMGRQPQFEDLLDEYSQVRLKRMTHAWRRRHLPSIVTHDMTYDAEDAVLGKLRACNLINLPDDPVKVVFHPEFMSSTSPLIGLDYDEFVRGCHLGVFPSYYEPWGYTPMECAALGVPAITSDLAGFGGYVERTVPDHDAKGMFVLERRYKSFDESADQLATLMQQVLLAERRDRIDLRNRVEALSVQFDWNELARNYWAAHELAVSRWLRAE
ncbi:MAG: glycosyltransferase [Proteobacteria bacterium]|jgi:glycogen(starch) synthase|nr:glycosyltransferase [Pseudomonadota bacterium]